MRYELLSSSAQLATVHGYHLVTAGKCYLPALTGTVPPDKQKNSDEYFHVLNTVQQTNPYPKKVKGLQNSAHSYKDFRAKKNSCVLKMQYSNIVSI